MQIKLVAVVKLQCGSKMRVSKDLETNCNRTLPETFEAFGRAEDLCDVYRIKYIPRYFYTMCGNGRTGSKLSDDLQSTRNSEGVFHVVRI